jgi:hypothetical protein
MAVKWASWQPESLTSAPTLAVRAANVHRTGVRSHDFDDPRALDWLPAELMAVATRFGRADDLEKPAGLDGVGLVAQRRRLPGHRGCRLGAAFPILPWRWLKLLGHLGGLKWRKMADPPLG